MLSIFVFALVGITHAQSIRNDSLLRPLTPIKSQLKQTDTILQTTNTVHLKISKNSFYSTLENYSQSTSFTRELHRMIIKTPQKEETSSEIMIASDIEFFQYEGFIIRNIDIKQLLPFGATVNDTSKLPQDWIQRTSNKIHKKTRENIIRNHLLIKSGEPIDPEVLSDNERLIRSLAFIEDVKIIIKPIKGNANSVDLLFIVKDVWPIGFDILLKNTKAGKIEVFDKNILGTGNQLDNTIRYDNNKTGKFGFEGSYVVPNIYKSFISGQIDVISAFHQTTKRISFNRDFFSKKINTAGGIKYEQTTNQLTINEIDKEYLFPLQYKQTYAWIGQKFQLKSSHSNIKPSIVFAASILNDCFTKRPPISESSFLQFHNKTQYLGTIAFTQQDFYKTNLLNSFGKTEDIPIGSLHQFTFGYEKSEFRTRFYGELSFSHGAFFNHIGYAYLSTSIGGYRFHKSFNQSTLKINGYAFSNLYAINNFKLRYWTTINYTNGFNRFYDEYLTLNDTKGIRGYNDPYLTGDQKLSINAEQIIFTPWSYLDFKFAVFNFIDFGWLGKTAHSVFDNPLYSGVGVGFRIRNERLVFKTIQIRLAYYPRLSNSAAVSYFLFSSADRITPSTFYVQPPVIHKFE